MSAILCSSEIYTFRLNSKTGFHLDFFSASILLHTLGLMFIMMRGVCQGLERQISN